MQKISFPKEYEDIDCKKDLNMDCPEGVIFRFWRNPSKHVFNAIMRVVLLDVQKLVDMPVHEQEEFQNNYNEALTAFVIDTNIDELNFNTVEEVEASFEAPGVPVGFVHEVISFYMLHLVERSDRLKKTLLSLFPEELFGADKLQEESELSNPSSTESIS